MKYKTPHEWRKALKVEIEALKAKIDAEIDAFEARRAIFKKRLITNGLKSTDKAAKAFGVSRFTIMNWKAGRRRIPKTADVILDAIEYRRREDFLS